MPRLNLSLLSKFSLVSFLLTAAIAVALALGIQRKLEQSALRQAAELAADQVATLLGPNLSRADLSGPLDPGRYGAIDALVRQSILREQIVRVKIWSRDGLLLYSDRQDLAGLRFPISEQLEEALAGEIATEVSPLEKAENVAERGVYSRLFEIYVPLRPRDSDEIAGAYEIYHDMAVVAVNVEDMRRFLWISIGLGFVVLYGSLFTLVRNASRELMRRNEENAGLYRDLSTAYDHTLVALAAALDTRDKETEGHSRRVVAYSLALARRLGLPEAEQVTLRRGALLHDIGKIGVPDAILLKPGPLSEAEWAIMRRHPEWGRRILAGIQFLDGAARIVYAHQERWDGSGYPDGLAGEAIPLGARLFAVADAFDAITSDRPYRAARTYAAARAEIEACRGTQFDPRVVEVFLQIPEVEWVRLRREAQTSTGAAGRLPLWPEALGSPALAAELLESALADGLTGAANRRALEAGLERELQRSVRYRRELSLILLDLDGFRAYNDAHGHPAGDKALRELGRLLQQSVRVVDLVARLGGEEFVVLLPETGARGAWAAAEKLRAAIEQHPFPDGRLTASLGVVACADADGASPASLLAQADQALWQAKRSGRNRACLWEPGLPESPRPADVGLVTQDAAASA